MTRARPAEDRWHSVDEMAAHLGVSRDTVYRWIELQNLPAHKIGRLWKFKKSEVDEWVRARHAEEASEVSPTRSDKPRR